MSFSLFIILNAVLLIRPEDLLPEIAGMRLYLIVISMNVLAALPNIGQRLGRAEIVNRPITLCILGLVVAGGFSQLAHGRTSPALDFVLEFAKVVIYYLLFISTVTTPARLRAFLGWIVAFVVIIAALGLLQFYGVIQVEALRPVEQVEYGQSSDEVVSYPRLCSSGIFNDPNDLCMILALGIFASLYRAATARNYAFSALWLLPIGLFGHAIMLTQSRGGLLSLLCGSAALIVAKWGWRRALPALVVGIPLVVFAVGGRQSNINLGSDDTGHTRVMLWAEGLSYLTQAPLYLLTGIGTGEYEDIAGQVAHNSFIHAYVEMGLFGGALFLVAFLLPVRMLYSLRAANRPETSPVLAAMQPFLLAMVIGYCGGMYSLSRNYIVPTYMCLGIAESYLRMVVPHPPPAFRVSPLWGKQTVVLGVAGLIFLKLFTQIAGSLGV